MKSMSGMTVVIGLFLIGVAVTPAPADSVIFSNLGPGDSYTNAVWAVGYPFNGLLGDYVIASGFTVGATSMSLSTIQVAAGLESGPNTLTINLDADAGGIPGATLESFTITGAMPAVGSVSSGNLVVATSVLDPLLTAGSSYWVVLNAPSPTFVGWNLNSTGDMGAFYYTRGGKVVLSGTQSQGAMLITGLAVPEPSSLVLAGIGAVVILGCGLRRRRGMKAA